MNPVYCNKCSNKFVLEESLFHTIKQDGLTVQYFTCPHCEMKYHVFTADAQMQELVEQRKAAEDKLRTATAQGFRKKTLRRYEKECRRIKKKQEDLELTLKPLGEKIIDSNRQTENKGEEAPNHNQLGV